MNSFHFHREEKDGFVIDTYALPEDINPADVFDMFEDQETLEGIESGKYEWFCAKVTASKNGIKLASEYLGGCCYKNLDDFINQDCYYGDMVRTVITEAKDAIKDLAL